jgi:hypothetical protein
VRLPVRLGLALLVVASMSLVIGASAFTGTEADRTVSVNVVADGDAYVGLTYDETVSVGPGDRVAGGGGSGDVERRNETALTIRNQFGTDMHIEVRGDESLYPKLRYETDSDENTATLSSGAEVSFDAIVTCENQNEADNRTVDVTVTAEGDGVSAEVTREVTVICEPNAGNNGQGPNAGNNSKGPNGNSSRA